MSALLVLDGLSVWLPSREGQVAVVDHIDLEVQPGEVVGVAGESGSGKTMTALALLGLLPPHAVTEGRAVFGDRDLLKINRRELRHLRGRDIGMVFQDPMTSLHPMLTIERQLTEHVRYHRGVSRAEARRDAITMLEEVRIPDPAGALNAYPHQFSGGMRQRIAIAIALACSPQLLIADEPTTAVDVTVQAGILRLFNRLRERSSLSIMFITHDLGVMASIADRLYIFYAGRVVESGPTGDLLTRPRHPYTRGLLDALPHPEGEPMPLRPIAGAPPAPAARPPGCPFHPRCPYMLASCAVDVPTLEPIGGGRRLACPVDPLREAS
ncbi:MAG TPA: ABC transporter ATP-binding protein [Candidatus Dormibacteraeota bacterium]|nr:ABC transporter ATP-binding protein [Candidatus Dormibacteraeota bacterium]